MSEEEEGGVGFVEELEEITKKYAEDLQSLTNDYQSELEKKLEEQSELITKLEALIAEKVTVRKET